MSDRIELDAEGTPIQVWFDKPPLEVMELTAIRWPRWVQLGSVCRPAPERHRMGFRYELRLDDGEDAGTFVSGRCEWQPGDEFIGDGNRRYRIRAVLPLPLLEEFTDGPLYETRDALRALMRAELAACRTTKSEIARTLKVSRQRIGGMLEG